MPDFKIIEHLPGTKNKYCLVCWKCKSELEINHLWFCYYICGQCKKRNNNALHRGYHSKSKCIYERSLEIDKELENRQKNAEVKNLKDKKIISP